MDAPSPLPSSTVAAEQQQQPLYAQNGFELSGRIMMSAIISLFALLVLFVVLHAYTRWFLLRLSSRPPIHDRHYHHSRRRIPNFVFTFSGPDPLAQPSQPPCGLDPALLRSLPSFVFSSDAYKDGLECSVCLCEFEEDEKGRTLAGCGHSFHIDCIDLWFQSHATCPLCRAEVKSALSVASATGEAEPLGTVSVGGALACTAADDGTSEGIRDETESSEAGATESVKPPPPPAPPESRFVGLRRILSRDRWVGSSSSFESNEVDLELGEIQR